MIFKRKQAPLTVLVVQCAGRESNPHAYAARGPQPRLSASSSTSA